ncbi:hypothetical protein GAMM_30021 [Gammaproteobacteria bacterium]
MNLTKKKTLKRIFSDFMTVLTVISIFVFSIASLVFIIFTFIASPAKAISDNSGKFQEAMQCVNSLKNKISLEKDEDKNIIKVGSFKLEPEKTFIDPKTKNSWYTDSPTQTNHYQDDINMKKEAISETERDYKDTNGNLVPTPGKAVTESFKKRPVFKISRNEEYIKKGELIEANAGNVITGESNKHIDCENKKLSTCKIVQVEKTCNEEVRTIRRICEKHARVTTYLKDVVYPDCKAVVVTTAVWNNCPGGYSGIMYADMVEGPTDDDVRICVRQANPGESLECLGGYQISGKWNNIHGNGSGNEGVATVPKKTHARIRFSNIYGHGRYLPVTIVNDTTGQTLHNNVRFYNGQVIDLPFSEDKDQVFRFYKSDRTSRASWRDIGVVILYIDHIHRERVANEPVWEESLCHDL